MNERRYIDEVLKQTSMEKCKPVGILFNVTSNLLKFFDENFINVQKEMKDVPFTKKDRSKTSHVCNGRKDQFMSKAGPLHWMAVKCIIRYLKGTLDFKLYLGGHDFILKSFCDVDWLGNSINQRSTTGYVFLVGIGFILWNCEKQPTIALSMT